MDIAAPDWEEIAALIEEIACLQRKKLLACGQQIIPNVTEDDVLQPNDFIELENDPFFRYEEGVLAGIQSVQMALLAQHRDKVAANLMVDYAE
jgi:hypothetical protein